MKWEYMLTSNWGLDEMNKLGQERWEFIATINNSLVWKREIK
ncbi:hypothetical protein LCGC14_0752460 [marine sediment metagenome]|uniref:DUF4177 domain-containing protein n=1 Tax=marine sediment metagenome TaxID=412755 RepID=A0A0F9SNS3_9ZZZZ